MNSYPMLISLKSSCSSVFCLRRASSSLSALANLSAVFASLLFTCALNIGRIVSMKMSSQKVKNNMNIRFHPKLLICRSNTFIFNAVVLVSSIGCCCALRVAGRDRRRYVRIIIVSQSLPARAPLAAFNSDNFS